MKRYTDYTNAELVDLMDDEVELLITLECAFEGVEFVPPPDDEPHKPDLNSNTYYNIEGTDLVYPTREAATEALNCAHKVESVYFRNYYSHSLRFIASWEDLCESIKAISLPNKSEIDKHREALDAWVIKQKQWETAVKEYDKYKNAREKLAGNVREAIADAKREHATRVRMQDAWATYMKLSSGNRDISKNFFINAYGEGMWEEMVAGEHIK